MVEILILSGIGAACAIAALRVALHHTKAIEIIQHRSSQD